MDRSRVVYQEWIVERGRDPQESVLCPEPEETAHAEAVRQAVTEALQGLSEDEREFVLAFHYRGETYETIARRTGRSVHKLEALHRRARRKLRRRLAGTVERCFGLVTCRTKGCPICESEHRAEIDALIAARDPRQTWRPILERLREQYGLEIQSPQLIIGHQKYHV